MIALQFDARPPALDPERAEIQGLTASWPSRKKAPPTPDAPRKGLLLLDLPNS